MESSEILLAVGGLILTAIGVFLAYKAGASKSSRQATNDAVAINTALAELSTDMKHVSKNVEEIKADNKIMAQHQTICNRRFAEIEGRLSKLEV